MMPSVEGMGGGLNKMCAPRVAELRGAKELNRSWVHSPGAQVRTRILGVPTQLPLVPIVCCGQVQYQTCDGTAEKGKDYESQAPQTQRGAVSIDRHGRSRQESPSDRASPDV